MIEEFDHFPQVEEILDRIINKLVRAAAFQIEGGAKSRAPVDTGFLKNSIYTRTEDSSDAAPMGGGLGQTLFPEVEAPGHNEALVAVGATYGIYVEYGTSRAAAQPYLTPAAEAVRADFIAAMQRLGDDL